jgi:hypothetical protein
MEPVMSRCPNCGVSLDPSASQCIACGTRTAASSVGAVSDRGYHINPMPVGPYNISFGATEALSVAFRNWSRDWGRLVGLAAIPLLFSLPLLIGFGVWAFVAMKPAGGGDPSVGSMIAMGGLGFVAFCVMMVGYIASLAGIVINVDERERTGGMTLSVWESFLAGLSKAPRLIVVGLVIGVIALVGFGPLFGAGTYALIAVADGNSEPAIAGLLGIVGIILFPFATYLSLRLMPVWTIAVVEDCAIGEVFSRAFALTKGHALTLFGALLLLMLVMFGIGMAGGILGLIPLLGLLVQIAVNLFTASLQPVWGHAIYAGLVNESQKGR